MNLLQGNGVKKAFCVKPGGWTAPSYVNHVKAVGTRLEAFADELLFHVGGHFYGGVQAQILDRARHQVAAQHQQAAQLFPLMHQPVLPGVEGAGGEFGGVGCQIRAVAVDNFGDIVLSGQRRIERVGQPGDAGVDVAQRAFDAAGGVEQRCGVLRVGWIVVHGRHTPLNAWMG